MKLLLDEMFSLRVAQVLRQRGHDVIGVTERSELRGRADGELLALMAKEGRVIVTNNTRDFVRVASQATAAGNVHAGVLLTSDHTVPRSRAALGRFAEIVDRFIGEAPPDMLNQVRWLSRGLSSNRGASGVRSSIRAPQSAHTFTTGH